VYRALIVCNSAYEVDPKLGVLLGPRIDGRLLGDALIDGQTGMFQPAEVAVLFDASSGQIAEAANRFFNIGQPEDVLLFYFSGHGRSKNQKLYLCGSDTVSDLLPSTAVSNETLNEIMSDSLARAKVVVLDCCHSGAFKGAVAVERLLSGKGRFVLTATAASELAGDSDEADQPSPFTRALVDGLLQGAVDRDGDGSVDLTDLYKYVREVLQGSSEPRHKFDGYGDVPIARRAVPVTTNSPPDNLRDRTADSPVNDDVASAHSRYLDQTTTATVLNPKRVTQFRGRMRRDTGRSLPRRGSAADFLRAALLMREGRLTRAGALLFGEDPTAVISTATVQCTNYHGTGKEAPLSKRDLGGTIPEQIEQARQFVAELAQQGEAPTDGGATTEPVYHYPMIAVREIIANALVHRDYEHLEMCVHVRIYADRIEVTSPGSWNGTDLRDGQTRPLRELQGESRQRNYWLAHVLSWNRLVESEGAGIPRAIADCRDHQAAEPVVTQDRGVVTVTIFPREANTARQVAVPAQAVDNLPLASAVFEGRDVTLLADRLDRSTGTAVIGLVIYGPGGVGKSQLAVHYARRYRQRYRVAWWIMADSAENVELGLAALAARLHPTGTLADAQAWALNWLQNNRDWLLVLDDVIDLAAVERVLGQLAGRGQILMTTRRNLGNAEWARLGMAPLPLDVLDPAASIRMLARLSGLNDEEGASRLAAELSYLPLALAQAAAYISQNDGLSFDGYRTLLRGHSELLAAGAEGRERTVAHAWQVSMAEVTRRAPLAGRLLAVMAWLAPDGLPEDVLRPLAANSVEFRGALATLVSYSLIARTDGMLRSHRLMQAVARNAPAFHDLPSVATEAASLLRAAIPYDPVANVAGWPRWNALLPHIDALIENLGMDNAGPDLTYVADQAATYRLFQGQVATAVAQFEQIHAHRQRMLGNGHLDTLTSRHNLASAYQTVGRLDEAIDLHEHVLADYRRLVGDDHPDTLASANNLARAYQAARRTPEAIALHERVLADSQRVLGDDHPDTLASRNNLALAYQEQGQLTPAISLLEQVLAARRRILGDDHPGTLASANNLARAYQAAGRTSEAIALHERVLADSQRVLGDDHLDTLASAYNLAVAYAAVGRRDEAGRLLNWTLAGQQRTLGENHPVTHNTASMALSVRTQAENNRTETIDEAS
jgi:tetratricopeptide (TPR) repeat protein